MNEKEIQQGEKEKVPQEQQQERKVKAGYQVVLFEDGKLDFKVLGSSPGLVELLGLHAWADKQLHPDSAVKYVDTAEKILTVLGILNIKLDKLSVSIPVSNQTQY